MMKKMYRNNFFDAQYALQRKVTFMERCRYLKYIEKVLEKGEYQLVSFGLAPNPWGFCFEFHGEILNKITSKTLSNYLDLLNESQENYLRRKYL